jgi:hypothetical protein
LKNVLLKLSIVFFLIISLFSASFLFPLFQPITIDFNEQLPLKFETCNGDIFLGTEAYKEIQSWFTDNQDDWENLIATPASGSYVLRSSKITIHVYENSVVIDYTDHEESRSKLSKSGVFPVQGKCN